MANSTNQNLKNKKQKKIKREKSKKANSQKGKTATGKKGAKGIGPRASGQGPMANKVKADRRAKGKKHDHMHMQPKMVLQRNTKKMVITRAMMV